MKLRKIGFFRELDHGDPTGPSLVELVSNTPQPDQSRIVDYLRRSGLLLIGCPGVVGDVLDETAGLIGSPNIMTDGVWAWPEDLPYYVERYHLALTSEFIEHVQTRSLSQPTISEMDLSSLEL